MLEAGFDYVEVISRLFHVVKAHLMTKLSKYYLSRQTVNQNKQKVTEERKKQLKDMRTRYNKIDGIQDSYASHTVCTQKLT